MKAYSETPTVPENVLSEVRDFVKDLFKGKSLHPNYLPKISSLSSCIESSRTDNGQAGYIEYLLN